MTEGLTELLKNSQPNSRLTLEDAIDAEVTTQRLEQGLTKESGVDIEVLLASIDLDNLATSLSSPSTKRSSSISSSSNYLARRRDYRETPSHQARMRAKSRLQTTGTYDIGN